VTSPRLRNGDRFPDLQITVVGGRTITLPADLAGAYVAVLFYRGSWCPYCNAQLAAFSRARELLAATDIAVVALSVDDEATSRAFVDKLRIGFPVGYGVNADDIAAATGATSPRVPATCNRQVSSSTGTAEFSSRCTRAGRLVVSSPTMWWGW
jgi:peroxiredoxin